MTNIKNITACAEEKYNEHLKQKQLEQDFLNLLSPLVAELNSIVKEKFDAANEKHLEEQSQKWTVKYLGNKPEPLVLKLANLYCRHSMYVVHIPYRHTDYGYEATNDPNYSNIYCKINTLLCCYKDAVAPKNE